MRSLNSYSNCFKNCNSCSKDNFFNKDFKTKLLYSSPLMIDKPRDHCGVFGISTPDTEYNIAHELYLGLMGVQHRGQEAAGISIVNGNKKIYSYKNIGLAAQSLNEELLRQYWGNIGIGHVRYGTTETSSLHFAQPYHFCSNQIEYSFGFNGTIANYMKLKKQLGEKGRIINSNSDTEVIATLFASISIGTKDWVEIFKIAAKFLDGSYSLTLLTPDGDIYAVRDPFGFKPLCYGIVDDNIRIKNVVASESCAIDAVNGKLIDDVKPGQVVHFEPTGNINKETFANSERTALCQFEFVYFARPDSIVDGVPVNKARENLGINLAKEHPCDLHNTIVVPVPDSGRSAASGYAKESGLPYEEGLMKNRYIWRTFIIPGQKKRENAVSEKLNTIRSIISGKNVVLIDDSIVRGTTMAQIVSLLKKGGAKSVHVRISCPPVKAACYMGIDFPSSSELLAGRMELIDKDNWIDLVRQKIGADSLAYQSINGLVKAIGLRKNQLCLACLNEEYVIKSASELQNLEKYFVRSRDRI